jgi:prenyltransferase beta subunit
MRRIALVCLGLMLCPMPATAQTPAEKQVTLAYLRSLQTPSGGFRPAKDQETPSLRATSSAARALKYFGEPLKDADTARRFIQQCFRPRVGGFVDQPQAQQTPDVTTSAIGLMAVVELQMPVEEYQERVVKYIGEHARNFAEIRIAAAAMEAVHARPPQADAWLKQIEMMRNPDGTYGKDGDLARETGSAVVAVLRLGGKVEQRANVLNAMRAGQRPDGGFRQGESATSDLASCYRIMRCFYMMKEKPSDVAALKQFIARCRNTDGGYGVAPGQASSVSGTYYAGIILMWLEKLA